jgi:hypothetical protein
VDFVKKRFVEDHQNGITYSDRRKETASLKVILIFLVGLRHFSKTLWERVLFVLASLFCQCRLISCQCLRILANLGPFGCAYVCLNDLPPNRFGRSERQGMCRYRTSFWRELHTNIRPICAVERHQKICESSCDVLANLVTRIYTPRQFYFKQNSRLNSRGETRSYAA